MLRNDLVADLFTQYFNEAGKEFDKVFEIYDSATDYKIVKPLSIVGILNETGGSVKPVMNYVNTTCNYEIGLLYSVEAGFGEIKKMNEIMENVIKALNGVPLQLSGGQALITFNQQHTGDYEIHRPQIGKSVIPKLAFKVEYSQQQDGLRYEMALIDTPSDMTTHDTRYFSSQSEQQTYYLNKVAESGVPFCEMMAPNVNSLTLQQQVYINDLRYYPDGTEKVKELNEILMKNYAIIRAMDGDTAVAYYYYWVQNATVGDNNQALLDLKMDTIQTWHFNPNLDYADCMIYKAHLNRWIDNGDGTVSFDGTVNSKLFEREDIQNVAKRLTKRTVLGLYDNSEIGQWLKENISNWIYIFWSINNNYKWVSLSDKELKERQPSEIYNKSDNGILPSNICVFAYPIYKSNKIIRFNAPNSYTSNIAWGDWTSRLDRNYSDSALSKFASIKYGDGEEQSVGYSYMYSVKVSIMPPFNNINNNIDYTIDSNGDLILNLNLGADGSIYNPLLSELGTGSGETIGVGTNIGITGEEYASTISLIKSQDSIITINYTTDKQFIFNKSDIIGKNKNIDFNPKLLSLDYFSLRLSDNTENGYDYDLQKLNSKSVDINFSESLTPDISKRYIRIKSQSGVYVQETSKNLTGFINSNDNTITTATSAYQQMLANNKNFFLQNSINRGFDIANTLISAGTGAIAGGGLGLVAGAGALLNLANIAKGKINENLTIDNLKNSPANIIAAKGNAIFENMYSENGVIVEEYDILPNEKTIINDYMDLYGFTYNQIDNIKNFDNVRYYHNYIQAEILNIEGVSISNSIRDDIKNRFQQGLRFWNNDNIQYDLENYEMSLLN